MSVQGHSRRFRDVRVRSAIPQWLLFCCSARTVKKGHYLKSRPDHPTGYQREFESVRDAPQGPAAAYSSASAATPQTAAEELSSIIAPHMVDFRSRAH